MQLITALATPFCGGKICLKDYEKLLETQRGADGILCAGTTAEAGLLTNAEKKILVRTAREFYPQKTLWAGISCGGTAAALKEAEMMKNLGADGILVPPPAFFKCTKSGFIEHILKIWKKIELPIMLYNAPSRCGYALWQDAVESLVGALPKGALTLKDAGGNVDCARALAKKLPLFCGNEEMLEKFVGAGCVGCVSVVGNIAPTLTKNAMKSFRPTRADAESDNPIEIEKRQSETLADDAELFAKLANLTFCALNPVPIKYMLFKKGIFSSCEMRLPLTAADEETQKKIDEFWSEKADRLR